MTERAEASWSHDGSELTEHELRRLVDRGPFGYVACTLHGEIVRANGTLLGWTGNDRSALVNGSTLQELLAPGDRIYFDTHLRPLLHMGGGVRDIAVELVATDGARVPVLLTASVVGSDPARLIEILLVDARARRAYERELVEERRRAEHAREQVQMLYDLVSGFASASTVDDVQRIVTAASASPFGGVRCHMWLFDDDLGSIAHVGPTESGFSVERLELGDRQTGAALGELADGRLVEVDDASLTDYPLIGEWISRTSLCSTLFAPLTENGSLIGALGFGFESSHTFSDDERRAVRSLAEQTSHALRRVRLFERLERARRQLEHLYEFGRSMSAAVTVDEVVAALSAAGFDHLGAIDVRIGRLDREGSLTVTGGRRDLTGTTIVQPPTAADVALAAVELSTDIVVASRSELSRRYPASASLADPEVEHVMAVPLADGDRVVGSWVVGFTSRIVDEDRTMLRLFADEAAQAIRRAGMHEREARVRRRAVVRQSISEALNRAATIDAVAEALVVEGRNAFDADGLVVFVVDDQSVTIANQIGLRPDRATAEPFPVDGPDVARLLGADSPRFAEGTVAVDELLGDLPLGRWRSAAALPLGLGGGRANGLVLVLYRTGDRIDVADRRALAGIAAEASVALTRAQLFDVEHSIAVTLQKSLLSEQVPAVDGWRIDPWYSPSNELLMVGGDLFDVVALADGRFVVVVGDVVGHGLDAAASLGQLRSASRALALEHTRPAEMLRRLDAFAESTPGIRGATLCCAIIEPSGAGRYACAGHPYPVLVEDRGAELLEGGRSALLGYGDVRDDASLLMSPGSSLVIYTDGVVERPHEPIDDGFERLRRLVEEIDFHGSRSPARSIGEAMMFDSRRRDDAVVVCVTRVR